MSCRIDLHVHSYYSGDSDADPEALIQHAIEAGLNGLAFTEHYFYEASEGVEPLRQKYGSDIMIFRGVEFASSDGHCLVFGVNTDRLDLRGAPMGEVVRIVNQSGGVVIPTHPYRGMNSIGESIKALDGICALEGYNGYSSHALNQMALETARVLNLPYTGGSDAHAARDVSSCYTEFAEQVTFENLIDRLREGNYRGVDTRRVSGGAWF